MEIGTIVLTDRKTGADNSEYETELQMTSYVIWATQYYHKEPDGILSELVFLKSGEKKPYPFFQEQLYDVQEIIKADFESMNKSYEFDDFPPRPSARECLSCKFGKFCPKSNVQKNL